MNNLEKNLDEISNKTKNIFEKYDVKTANIFGSRARGDNNYSSDFDILISFNQTPTLIDFIRLKNELSEVLGNDVDLVSENAILSPFRQYIVAELIKIYG